MGRLGPELLLNSICRTSRSPSTLPSTLVRRGAQELVKTSISPRTVPDGSMVRLMVLGPQALDVTVPVPTPPATRS